jgi:ribA/ribD-fused uncharacterized protein
MGKNRTLSMKIAGNYYFFYTNFLSNWHRQHFTDPNTGVKFLTTEQAFMWYKADFFKDSSVRLELAQFPMEPRAAKDLGRMVRGYDESRWECVREGFMVYANYLKYSQNPDLGQKLLETGDLILVEASPIDLIWGIGLGEKEEDSILINEKNWRGRNLLGKSLMKVRSLLAQDFLKKS